MSHRDLFIGEREMAVIDRVLVKLRSLTRAQLVALISASGQPIGTAPPDADTDALSLAALAAGSFAATRQLAELLKEKEFTLLFHEGKESNLHVVQVTDQFLLLITFGRDVQIGRMRLFTQRAVEALKPVLDQADVSRKEHSGVLLDDDYWNQAGIAIDTLPNE
ncbi:MAG: roadblock/LC7 domain-containing protein [Thermoleophilia bacterium]|nr:roadblock/LC7 domain-containing protein [Thermoleophilia bacterium]